MNSTNSTPTPENLIYCAYCQDGHENTPEVIRKHMLNCKERPEYALLVKIELLKHTGDETLVVLHEFAKAIGEFEGGMTGVWEIYRQVQESWTIAKNTDAAELAKTVNLENVENEEKNN